MESEDAEHQAKQHADCDLSEGVVSNVPSRPGYRSQHQDHKRQPHHVEEWNGRAIVILPPSHEYLKHDPHQESGSVDCVARWHPHLRRAVCVAVRRHIRPRLFKEGFQKKLVPQARARGETQCVDEDGMPSLYPEQEKGERDYPRKKTVHQRKDRQQLPLKRKADRDLAHTQLRIHRAAELLEFGVESLLLDLCLVVSCGKPRNRRFRTLPHAKPTKRTEFQRKHGFNGRWCHGDRSAVLIHVSHERASLAGCTRRIMTWTHINGIRHGTCRAWSQKKK
mmetsp:Transcript_4272/g.12101  ORF Transcript_4272/g.12101 Transcript_4272/m.12101 type:complete len:279 (-) Transcript_4272:17-853(-)